MSVEARPPLLEISEIVAGYGGRDVLHGVSIEVGGGEVVALVGHNGSGKSTLLKSIFGIVPLTAGEIRLEGEQIRSPNPKQMLRVGVAYMPQGQRVFDDLTVLGNLEVAAAILPERRRRALAIEEAFALFEALQGLRQRSCRSLSGGERQMVALATVLLTSPRLLLLDEPSLGLAPQLFSQLLGHLADINAKRGVAMLIVEQRIRAVVEIAHRTYIMKNGKIAQSGASPSTPHLT